jgi:DNA invertase Pin-like site-specific DNA recombinase
MASKESMELFAIYVRVSDTGGKDGQDLHSPEDQEAAARTWAERHEVDVYFDEEECVDLDVSGGLSADDRKLGKLIERCEAGEFAGVIVRYESRFARDTIAGGVALNRLHDCGARLIATATGFDSQSLNSESRMIFNIMMSVAQAERERNRGNYMGGKLKQARRGVWCAIAPFGYDRDEEGRLVPNEDQEAVREIFRLRAQGIGFSDIARDLPMTRSGVRKIVMNRAYVGEQRIPDPDSDEIITLRNNHPPIVSEPEWEAANAVKGRAPIRRGLGEAAKLKGLVRCGTCGSAMHVLSYGEARDKITYACTKGGCGAASLAVSKLEFAVLYQLQVAIGNREPHIAAVIEGDTRYADALDEVQAATDALAEYRDNIEMQKLLGMKDFAAGLKIRKEAVETARRALRELPRPEKLSKKLMTLDEFDLDDRRRFYARAIAMVLVYPRSAPERLTLCWQGSDEFIPVPLVTPTALPVAA